MRFFTHFLLATLVLFLSIGEIAAAERSAPDLFPASTVAYVEIPKPSDALNTLLEHPLRKRIEALDDVKKQLEGEKFEKFRTVVKFIELQLGMSWREAVEVIVGNGIFIGFDAETKGVAVLTHASDENKLTKIHESLLKLARADAKKKGKPERIESKEYRGLTAYKIDKGYSARVGSWFVMSNKNDLMKAIADAHLDGAENSLASVKNFRDARDSNNGKQSGWGYVNFPAIREAGVAKKLFADKHDNPVAEIVVGGILSTLKETPYLTLQVDLTKNHIQLSASTPFDAKWIPEQRQFFFGEDGNGAVGAPLLPKETLLSIESFRDAAAFWLSKEDLFEEKVVARLAQADSQLSTLFSGLDFGQEVLSAVKPQSQFVLARQRFDDPKLPKPDSKLPAGAYILQLKDRKKMERRLKVVFQSLIGLSNYGLAKQGQPQFDVNTETRGDVRIISAEYVTEDSEEGLINYNFSPTIAFAGDWFFISSTKQLAIELAELAAKHDEQSESSNVHAMADLKVLQQVLTDNRDQLIAQNKLEKGHNQEEAEKEIGTVLDLLNAGRDASFRLRRLDDSLKLELSLRFAE